MKDDTILLLAGVGIVGYGLLKSDFFKGVGQVGTGLGEAVGGLGSGINTAAGGLGEGIKQIGFSVEDILSITKPLGEGFNRLSQEVRESSLRSDREFKQETTLDQAAFIQALPQASSYKAVGEVETAKQSSLRTSKSEQEKTTRNALIEENKTQLTKFITTIDDKIGAALKRGNTASNSLRTTKTQLLPASQQYNAFIRAITPKQNTSKGLISSINNKSLRK